MHRAPLARTYQLSYEIAAANAIIGEVVPIDTWAKAITLPDDRTGRPFDGSRLRELVGINAKSWDQALFRQRETIHELAIEALAMAETAAAEISHVIVVTCNPYEIMLDQDAFFLMRAIGIDDAVVPVQLNAGCAGMARALALSSRFGGGDVLIVTYNLPSLIWQSADGEINRLYAEPNYAHPHRTRLWATAATFSDGAAAVVLRRTREARGVGFYSRDSQSFGSEPPFAGQVVYYPGGGALHPVGVSNNADLCAFGLASGEIREYYSKGMMLNHLQLQDIRGDYPSSVSRIYTHQASPALVEDFVTQAAIPPEKAPRHCAAIGNLVSPCTMKLLHDDLARGAVRGGDEICVSVVGAGPERGAFIAPLALARR